MTVTPYFLGLDLGQPSEPSALAILERQGPPGDEAVFHCRHLQRWPLRTSYSSIVDDVSKMCASEELQGAYSALTRQARYGYRCELEAEEIATLPLLALDATAVGPPVVGLFRAASVPAQLRAVQVTGGATVIYEGGATKIPKRDLVSIAQVALQDGRLKVAGSLPEAATLMREMQNFRVKISLGPESDTGAWREGAHDDLVLAVCLALWWGVRQMPEPELPRSYGYYSY